MNNQHYLIKLNDSTKLSITAVDSISEEIVDFFAKATNLKAVNSSPENFIGTITVGSKGLKTSLAIEISGIPAGKSLNTTLLLEPKELYRFPLREPDNSTSAHRDQDLMTEDEWKWRQLSRLSSMVGRYALLNGGFLYHGGLADFRGKGVLLAGASGSGKTSASILLKDPWTSLSDDLTIVVKDDKGKYFAHPLPTWSVFFGKELSVKKNFWELENKIPVSVAVFFDRGPDNRIKKAGKAHSLCLLTELAKQSNRFLLQKMDLQVVSEFNKKFFLNINEFIRKIPGFTLELDLKKEFWEEMEKIPGLN